MVELTPMTASSFEAFLAASITEYAHEKVQNGEWPEATAAALAHKEFAALLPQGTATPGQFLYDLYDPSVNAKVGVLWFGMRGPAERLTVFVYDVSVHAAFRRRGYATRAFELLRQEAAALGASSITLHVFGQNHGARALYLKLGYAETNVLMRLNLHEHLGGSP